MMYYTPNCQKLIFLLVFCRSTTSRGLGHNKSIDNFELDNAVCGIKPPIIQEGKPISFIYGGDVVVPHSIPWQAHLPSAGCGGALIGDRYVLTAGHCTQGKELYQLEVILGQHTKYPSDGTTYEACKKSEHPKYKTFPSPIYPDLTESVNYDFSIIHLCEPAKLNSKVQPVCLPKDHSSLSGDFLVNKIMTVSGWGWTEQGKSSNKLRSVGVPGMTNKGCAAILNPIEKNTIENCHLCASNLEPDHFSGSCRGDSGGPLTYDDGEKVTIVGVVSYGPGVPPFDLETCNAPKAEGRPDVYARVTSVLEWIKNEMKN